ncbi:hypothetical protein [Halegenticoccus tardaugens]|uniref:hypothetical protein n=1 Tax=Halegenticoccus tardaugens TaxID=2071624 RepID=UPI0013E932F4|nr:hypothetical protein [Halegenticoccus tardaugens]
MGTFARKFAVFIPREDVDGDPEQLGDVLRGRLSDVPVDSVEAVRDVRERE